jgi:hypothetical protein
MRSRAQPEEGSPAKFHVLIAGVVRDEVAADEPFHTHETFGSAMVALAHTEETIQYFDMLDEHIVTGDELIF